jgi:hypothetical protein
LRAEIEQLRKDITIKDGVSSGQVTQLPAFLRKARE